MALQTIISNLKNSEDHLMTGPPLRLPVVQPKQTEYKYCAPMLQKYGPTAALIRVISSIRGRDLLNQSIEPQTNAIDPKINQFSA